MATQNNKASKGISSWGLAFILLSVIAAFFFGMHAFAYLKTTVKMGFLVSWSREKAALLDPASGSIEEIQLAPKPRFLDEKKKPLSFQEWETVLAEDEKAKLIAVTIRPDGKCAKIEMAEGSFFAEGEVVSLEESKMKLGKSEYPLETRFFLEGGAYASDENDGKPSSEESLNERTIKIEKKTVQLLSRGDVVRCWGTSGKILIIERKELAGSLKITSNVDGVKVFLNGLYQGTTPLVIKTSPGQKELLARLSGYKDLKSAVAVEPEKEKACQLVLERIVGHISISSDPLGASVYLDGQLKGKTPWTADLPPGEYNCVLKLEGYYPRNVIIQVNADETVEVDEILTKISSGGITPIGNGTGPIFGETKPPLGLKVTVLHNWSALGALEAKSENGDILRLAYSESVPLKSYPYGTASWEKLLPGEELVVRVGAQSRLEEATKTYAHSFSLKGKIVKKGESQITVMGQKWAECTLSPKPIVQSGDKDFPWNLLGPGDAVTLYGSSQEDIRYVNVEKPLGEKMSLEGFLVKTSTGLRLFNDSSMTNIVIAKDLDVADPTLKKIETAQNIPSGSRLNFYLNPVADVVFAQVISRATVSLEGQIGSLSGASFFLIPSWQELFLNDKTHVFVDTSRRPYYDLKMGDIVQAAGPSPQEINFIWVEERLRYERTAVGFMTSKTLGRTRLFAETSVLGSSGSKDYVLWPLTDSKAAFTYPSQRKNFSLREINPGDKLKLYLDKEGKVKFGEVIEKNQVNLKTTYLGQKDGFYYFAGFKRLIPRKDLMVLGLGETKAIYKGSKVFIGGAGDQLNYIEVEKLLNPTRWAIGTFLSGDRSGLRVYLDSYAQDFKADSDFWFCDWQKSQDGPLKDLFPGDRVSVAIDSEGRAVFAERNFTPPFKYEGEVVYVQGRYLTIKGKSDSKSVSILSDAYVEKNGEKVSYWDIKKGDKVKVSGHGADWISVVVSGR